MVANASPVNSICDHQISNWFREIFKYNTVISLLRGHLWNKEKLPYKTGCLLKKGWFICNFLWHDKKKGDLLCRLLLKKRDWMSRFDCICLYKCMYIFVFSLSCLKSISILILLNVCSYTSTGIIHDKHNGNIISYSTAIVLMVSRK